MNKAEPKIMSLAFACEPSRVLLGFKKRGFGMGKWNGFGGKIDLGETIQEAAERELFEECGIRSLKTEPAGFIHFDFENPPIALEVHLFRVPEYEGEPEETEEMKPQWFRHEDIPYAQMWDDDKYWLPALLEGKKIKGNFTLDSKGRILKQELEIS